VKIVGEVFVFQSTEFNFSNRYDLTGLRGKARLISRMKLSLAPSRETLSILIGQRFPIQQQLK